MRHCLFVALFATMLPTTMPLLLTPVHAKSIRAPKLTIGDSWAYAESIETKGVSRTSHVVMTLKRADSRLIAVEVHPVGSSAPSQERLLGPNWSVMRSVNGQQTVVNQPLSFPLTVGKTWTLTFAEVNPSDRTHAREQFSKTYKVGGWEDVTVAAGTFHALRIDVEGTWTADLPANVVTARGRAPNGANVAVLSGQGARVASGRLLDTFWYVPEVQRWVKSEEGIYSSTGVRTKHIMTELEAFEPVNVGGTDADSQSSAGDSAQTEPAPATSKRTTARRTSPAPPVAPAQPPAAVTPPKSAPQSQPLLQEL